MKARCLDFLKPIFLHFLRCNSDAKFKFLKKNKKTKIMSCVKPRKFTQKFAS